jgi:hypothetical protein
MEVLRRGLRQRLSVSPLDGGALLASVPGFCLRATGVLEDVCSGVRHASGSKHVPPLAHVNYDMQLFKPEQIRNFSIIGSSPIALHEPAGDLDVLLYTQHDSQTVTLHLFSWLGAGVLVSAGRGLYRIGKWPIKRHLRTIRH